MAAVAAPAQPVQVKEPENRKRVLSGVTRDALLSLWHYDPNYTYDLERYEYGTDYTTDPYYVKEGVLLPRSRLHTKVVKAIHLMIAWCRLVGTCLPLRTLASTQDYKIGLGQLPDVAELPPDQQPRSVAPDLALWAGDLDLPNRSVEWSDTCTPQLVIEVLSEDSRDNDLGRKPCIYRDMGVQEYYVIDPDVQGWMAGYLYNRDLAGAVMVDPESGIYSKVLATNIRNHAEQGFQLQDPATGNWMDASLERRYAEQATDIPE